MTLKLTADQADSIATMNRRYVIQLDSIWTPVTRYYATLPEVYDQGDAYDRYRRAREASVDVLVGIVPSVKSLLTRRAAAEAAGSHLGVSGSALSGRGAFGNVGDAGGRVRPGQRHDGRARTGGRREDAEDGTRSRRNSAETP